MAGRHHFVRLEVDGVEYGFRVGSAFVHVNGLPLVRIDEVGELVVVDGFRRWAVTDDGVAAHIRKIKSK